MNLIDQTRAHFESYLKQSVLAHIPSNIIRLEEMVGYHFGWNKAVEVPGKRLRPLFILLSFGAFGGDPEKILAPAAAIETLHNYTLVHDDIEDDGETRHGQPALWRKYGMPLAINVGDYLASLSHTLMSETDHSFEEQTRVKAISAFQEASLDVIKGQQLDMSYETFPELPLEDYLEMIRLKTSRLFAASLRISAILSGQSDEFVARMDALGEKLGIGFQIQDDYLGIWGNEDKTGKSVSTDLMTRKKAYPALLGITRSSRFAEIWRKDSLLTLQDLEELKTELELSGIREETLNLSGKYYQETRDELLEFLPSMDRHSGAFLGLVDIMFAPSVQA